MAPLVTPDSKFFWEAADQERFVGEKCGACGRFTFPPRPMCPYCSSLERKIVELSGFGTVQSWVLPRHPPAFGFQEPPIVALIELQEGIRFVANLVGVRLEDVKLDMPVAVAFEPTQGNHKVPVFKPRPL
jgi:hypothetical protein